MRHEQSDIRGTEIRGIFPYKLVALDLDGTLLGPDKRISSENRAAVRRLLEIGVPVVLASGRPHHNCLPFHQQLGLRGPIVSGNGAVVRVAETGETWRESLLDGALAREVIAEGKRIGITQIWDGPDGVWTLERTDWSEVLASRLYEPIPVRPAPENVPPYKMLWIADEAAIAEHERTYRAKWGDRSYVVCTDPEYLEFGPPGVHKAVGLGAVCARLGLTPADVLALGDGDNDVEMLRWAGVGAAPFHARPKACEAADLIGETGPPETAVAPDFREAYELIIAAALGALNYCSGSAGT